MSTSNLIYLLEDEIDLASVFRRALEESGIAVEHFRRLHEFRSALKTRRPSLCIIDLGLPDGDGLCLLGEELGSETIPTIVVSGRTSLNAKLIGLEQGADDYLSKPVEPAELVARVKTVLRRAGRQEGQPVRKHQETAEQLVARFGDWICDFESFTSRTSKAKPTSCLGRRRTSCVSFWRPKAGSSPVTTCCRPYLRTARNRLIAASMSGSRASERNWIAVPHRSRIFERCMELVMCSHPPLSGWAELPP